MQSRVAVMSIIVENVDSVEALNADQNTISALSGKIGKLSGVSVKTAYSGVTDQAADE